MSALLQLGAQEAHLLILIFHHIVNVRQSISVGPLLSALLTLYAPEYHLLILIIHHIVTDGWSMTVIQREVALFYRAALTGTAPGLPELPIQYADFAHWQRQRFTGEVLERQ